MKEETKPARDFEWKADPRGITGPATGYCLTDWELIAKEGATRNNWPIKVWIPDGMSHEEALAMFKQAIPGIRRESKKYFKDQKEKKP